MRAVANPAADAAQAALQEAALAAGTVSARIKRLIAVGCVHNIRCPRCIEREVRAALDAGEERAAISEAVWVAVEMAAGATFGHAGLAAALMVEEAQAALRPGACLSFGQGHSARNRLRCAATRPILSRNSDAGSGTTLTRRAR